MRILIMLIVAITLPLNLPAKQLTLEFGGLYGYGVSKLTEEYVSPNKGLSSQLYGGFISISNNDWVRLRIEFLSTLRGSSGTYPGGFTEDIEGYELFEARYSYIETPILLNFIVNTQSQVHLFFNVGFALASLQKAEIKSKYNGRTYYLDLPDTKKTANSLIVGGGVAVNIKQHRISAELRFVGGSNDIFIDTFDDSYNGTTNMTMFLLGYSYLINLP
jgi:hypothetical protein